MSEGVVCWAVEDVVLNSFVGLLAGRTDGSWGFADAEEILIEGYMTCMELCNQAG